MQRADIERDEVAERSAERAERLLKSELARKKRHMKRAIVEKRTQEEYRRLRKLRNQRKKHL